MIIEWNEFFWSARKLNYNPFLIDYNLTLVNVIEINFYSWSSAAGTVVI